MKKTLLILALFAGTLVHAQTSTTSTRNKPIMTLGLKGGLNLANVESDIYPNSETRKGYHVGLLAHIHLSPHIALQPEATYSTQGFKQTISSGFEIKGKLDYVNVPVLFQYMYRGFRLETGPQAGFLVNAEGKYNNDREDQLRNNLKDVDFSWDLGASYLSVLGVGVSARYNYGINNINKSISAPGVTNTELSNRVWQFSLFYQFR